MGYDMYWRTSAEAEDAYFRLNIFGMSRYRNLMEEFGMAFQDTPHPEWPKPDDYGITYEDVAAVDYPEDYPDRLKAMTPETFAKITEYQIAQNQVLTWHGMADTPGIPFHKLGSNDGWIVLPAECEAAVKAWRAYCGEHGEDAALRRVGDPDRRDHWKQWIAYLADAAKHDGFEVN